MILDDGGDATLFVHLGYQAEKDPKVLDRKPGSEEEKICWPRSRSPSRDPGRFHRMARTSAASAKRRPPACTACTR
jgi:adenosylhomocysteinase